MICHTYCAGSQRGPPRCSTGFTGRDGEGEGEEMKEGEMKRNNVRTLM